MNFQDHWENDIVDSEALDALFNLKRNVSIDQNVQII